MFGPRTVSVPWHVGLVESSLTGLAAAAAIRKAAFADVSLEDAPVTGLKGDLLGGPLASPPVPPGVRTLATVPQVRGAAVLCLCNPG